MDRPEKLLAAPTISAWEAFEPGLNLGDGEAVLACDVGRGRLVPPSSWYQVKHDGGLAARGPSPDVVGNG
jgi:hypothetical protein